MLLLGPATGLAAAQAKKCDDSSTRESGRMFS
jgi:hypothetical protein